MITDIFEQLFFLSIRLARVVLRKMEEYLQFLPSPQPQLLVDFFSTFSTFDYYTSIKRSVLLAFQLLINLIMTHV